MRNMIYKTLFASILGSLLVAPFAHADRQGGGTLKVAFRSEGPIESVRFKSVVGEEIKFDYSWVNNGEKIVVEVSLDRASIQRETKPLIDALVESKKTADWSLVPTSNHNVSFF